MAEPRSPGTEADRGLPHSECVEAYHGELIRTGRTIMSVARVRDDAGAVEHLARIEREAAKSLDVDWRLVRQAVDNTLLGHGGGITIAHHDSIRDEYGRLAAEEPVVIVHRKGDEA